MANNNHVIKTAIVSAVFASIITAVALLTFKPALDSKKDSNQEAVSDEKKPLYWVAPMDANYRRDKPGKSPMGMDLVPVYADDGSGPDEGVGTINIAANVENNLGVRTAKAKYQSLQTKINTVGYVTYDEDRLVHIHPRVEGWIEKLYVKAIGDPVVKGQPLYEIYSPELVNAQEELLLALDRKNKRLISAAQNRLMALQLPKTAIDNLKKTRTVKQNITFHAPQNGVVENLKIREGYYVKPGSTLMSIGDLSEVWVEGEVFERQAGQVTTGTPVTMTLDYLPGKTWQGQVDYIYPTLDAKTRTVKVRLRFANNEGLFKPNMFAQVAIHTNNHESALLIPKEALIRTGNQDRVVLALGQGSFKSIAVKVGRYDSEHVEILSGLNEGDKVVSSAQFLLDSESSKSSDFKRMSSEASDDDSTAVWVEAQVQGIMADHHMLTLTHQPIDEWGWPEMTMDFTVAKHLDIEPLSLGQTLHIEVTKQSDSKYIVSAIHIPDNPKNNQQTSPESEQVSRASTSGTVVSLMKDHGMISIDRQAIEKWNRPAATVDFVTADNVSLASISQGMQVDFTFEVRDGNFIITELAQAAKSTEQSADHSHH